MDADLERADRQTLVAVIVALRERIAALEAQVATLAAREADLEHRDPQAWAKANRPTLPQPRPPRKQRERNFSRRVEASTETVAHAVEGCSDCGTAPRGGRVRWRRQVLDQREAPVRAMEHVVERRCRACGRTTTPHPDLSNQVLDQHCVSLRMMARIAVLREQLCLPVRRIQAYLQTLHGLHLSRGELVAILQAVAKRAETAAVAIREVVRRSPVVHADETGWREGGQNRHVWSFSTPWLRYFLVGSRRAEVVARRGPPATLSAGTARVWRRQQRRGFAQALSTA